MSYLLGDTITDYIGPVRDGAGTLIPGLTATLQANLTTRDPNGATFVATITEPVALSALYKISFSTTGGDAGEWYWTTFYAGPPIQDWYEIYDVDSSAVTPPAAGISATSGSTLKALRRIVGRGLGDCVVCVATDDGTTQTFLDDEHLDGPDNAYKGFDLYFTNGNVANLMLRRRITASTQATGSTTWNRTLPAATEAGDEAELWNTRGIGIKPTEVNDAINDAIVFASHQVTIPVEAAVVAAFDRDSPILTIPAAISRGIYAVVWEDDDEMIQTIDPANGYGREGWYYDRSAHRVVIGGSYLSFMDGQTVTIKGVGRPAALSADTDTTSINAEWLVAEATRRVMTALRMKNPDAERWLPPHWQESMQKRELPTGRGYPNMVTF